MPFGAEVTVQSASGLDKKDNPTRVVVQCGPVQVETASLKMSGNSLEWQQTFYMSDCPDSEPIIYFNVLGKSSAPLAVGELAVDFVRNMQEWRGDIPLRGSKGPAGSLSVRCKIDAGNVTGQIPRVGGPPPVQMARDGPADGENPPPGGFRAKLGIKH